MKEPNQWIPESHADSPRRASLAARRPARWILLAGVGVAAIAVGFFFGRLPPRVGAARQPTEPRQPPSAAQAPEPAGSSRGPEDSTQAEAAGEATTDEVARLARRLAERFPDSPDALAVVARAQFWLGNSAAAEETCQRSLKLDPGFAPAYQAMGTVAAKKGDYEKAAQMYRKAWSLDPRLVEAAGYLADALINLGEAEEAAKVLEESIRRQPRVAGSHFLLGQARLQTKEFEKARQSFEKTVALVPTYTQAYYGLAVACTRLGQVDPARRYREQFEVLKAKDQERERNRLTPFEHAASMREAVGGICRAAAEAYQRHGELSESERLRRRAQFLNPAQTPQ